MLGLRFGPQDLLEYNARYGVLICRECQYAIQKSALQSHLLRHKIYRDERQRLLFSISQLDLFEPDHVPLPTPSSPPINALPVISGYRCTAVGCGNLCASSKRMRRHWSEIHSLTKAPNSSFFAYPVNLQTFFRGTKLRYFEVTSEPAAGTAGADDERDDDELEDADERDDEQLHDADTATLLSPPSSPINLDLEVLKYFHHFTTITSLTLPGVEHPRSSIHYWQTDVVLQALRQRWLMCGLLAISACHLAALADDSTIERVHRERLAQFLSEFSAGWEETTKRDLGVVAIGGGEDLEAKKAGGQIGCMLRCANWPLTESTVDQEIISELVAPSQLQSIIAAVRGFVIADFVLRPSVDSGNQEETLAHAGKILKIGSSESSLDARGFGNTPSALLNHLRALPSQMAEAFGRPEPDSVQDVLATLSAIATLVECCGISFESDEVEAAWRGMAMWLSKVPDHFHHMVSRHDLAALVVLAHWAALLVQRAEHCGCWFLRGSTKKILSQIAEKLPTDDCAIQSLVEGVMA